MIELKKLTFDEIRKVWATQLWPGRKSPIEPMSAMRYQPMADEDPYDMDIFDIPQEPLFAGAFDGNELIGVNSGHLTSNTVYRSRGLWVHQNYRGQGIAQRLLREILLEAFFLHTSMVWTIPRQSAYPTYDKVGFVRTSVWFDEGVEFGPNCYATADPSQNAFVRHIKAA